MTENETDRVLHLLVGLVVVSGIACLAWAGFHIDSPPTVLYPIVLVGLVAVSRSLAMLVHVRAQQVITPTSAAILVTVALLPWPWAIVCTAGGIAVALAARQPPKKAAFNTAKETVGATAMAAVFYAMGLAPVTSAGQAVASVWAYLGSLSGAALVYAAVDAFLVTPVVALASRTPWRRVIARDADLVVAIRVANLAVAFATVALFAVSPWLLAVTPLAVFSVYLAYRQRLHLREERRAWQRLAASTDALGSAGLDEVLNTALRGAVDLFPDLEIEVELGQVGSRRLVRGDQGGIGYDGEPALAPARTGPTIEVPLEADPGANGPLGLLRLRFRVEAKLSDHEQHMLTTFAAGLSTAIRNASAYARVAQLAEKNAHDATHDALTDLPNRRQLHESMAAALGRRPRGGAVALMLLDLDHFKEVNDTLGHAAGDRVLVEVAERLCEGAEDAVVTRLGGDEFAVLFTGLGAPALAQHRARQVLEVLRRPMDMGGVHVSLQASAGLAVAGDSTDPGEMLRRADVAMYQSKESGRQVAVYAKASDSADLSRLSLAGELPRAVEGQEFTVGFQPIVDLASGMVVAAEALTRWQHPDLGHLQPATFLGLIERSGLLSAFTQAVLDRALAAAADWHAAGFDLQVAVNISPRSLGDPELPKMVLHALDTSGVDPHRLTLEVTETAAIGHLDVAGKVVSKLRREGVRIALDDFGTGHSSLAAVFHVPVDQLKIDRTFVAALDSSAKARALIRATIELSRELDLMVVAEGVQQTHQRRALWELGCTAGQGSLFGWPARPSDELVATLRRGRDGVQGAVAEQLHAEGTVVRLPRQPPRSEKEFGHQA